MAYRYTFISLRTGEESDQLFAGDTEASYILASAYAAANELEISARSAEPADEV